MRKIQTPSLCRAALEHPQGWPWYSGTPTSFSPAPAQNHGVGKNNNNRDNAMTTSSNTDQTEQPASATNKLAVDFSHRLSDPSSNSSLSLIDNVSSMVDRASGILSLLFWHFQTPGAGSPPDGALCMAIDAAIKEIEDIKVTVSAYCGADIAKEQVQS